ncbi:hypothetical protein PVAND_007889 [Polypedilum vanderplanki]|uniref:Zinc finger protein n=1 Tax=Polypedilum vanderplanki TaxID=319348 RepID=A0A9J6C7Q6_POLVA|nr:hypothetical protein PVAND_007889 [Polypedilum vanderplanki]
MESSFENFCRFCLSKNAENLSLSLDNDKILIRLQNKLIDLKKVLKSLNLHSDEKELPKLVCHVCKDIILNFYQLKKTYQENESVLIEKSSSLESESCNVEKEKLIKTVEEFYSEFEDGELNIIKYKDKLVIEKLNVNLDQLQGHHESVVQETVESHIEESVVPVIQYAESEESMKEEYLTIDEEECYTTEISIKIDEQIEENTKISKKRNLIENVQCNEHEMIMKKKVKENQEIYSYSCSNCLALYPDEKSANEHITKYATNNLCKTSKCNECGILFQSEIIYQKHVSYHFLSKMSNLFSYFECSMCKIIFGIKKDIEQHEKQHLEDKNFIYKFERKSQIEGCEIFHRELFDGEDTWNCGHCDMKFDSKNDINFHLTLFHANVYCPFCKQSFGKSIPYLVNHLKLKHPEKFEEIVFNCSFCNESFSVYLDMKNHEKICKNKKFSCTHCDKKFALERQLKEHLDSIKGEFKFSCDICKKSFTNKNAYTVHKRIHLRLKPYICTFDGCQKSFRTNSQLSAHMDIHSEFKNFKCKFCEILFQTRGARRVHEKTHYQENLCKICDSVFKQRPHLIRHINTIHKIKCDSKNMEKQVELYLKT